MAQSALLRKMTEICLALPDTKLTMTWGSPHFRVGEKIFAGCGEEKGKASIGFKLEMDHAKSLIASDERFTRAPYVGHKGWVSMDAKHITDWGEVRALVFESYRLIAPKRTLAKLDDAPAPSRKPSAKKNSKKRASKKTPARKR
jgi:predicted DNA-binding protein (MmcQ/YjbR family)